MLDANPDFNLAAAAAATAAGAQPALVAELTPADADARLVAAWLAGDRTAMEGLYHRHAERVWRYARYFAGREDAAAEILQETFLRVIRHLHGFEGRARFGTWLFTVARSAALDYLRARQKNRAGAAGGLPMDAVADDDLRLPAANHGDPALQAETGETRAQVRAAVAGLPDAEREAIVLLELEGLSVQAAAEILGWSTAKTKVTVFRARRRLRAILQPLLHPPDSA